MNETLRSRRRVVITGMGAITPAGQTVDEFWDNLINGRSGVGYLKNADSTEFPCKVAGEILPDGENPSVARRLRLRLEESLVDRNQQGGRTIVGDSHGLHQLEPLRLAERDHARRSTERTTEQRPPPPRRTTPDQVEAVIDDDDRQPPRAGGQRKDVRKRREDDVRPPELERQGQLAQVPGDPVERRTKVPPRQERIVDARIDAVRPEVVGAEQRRVRLAPGRDSCEELRPRIRIDEGRSRRRPH